MTIEDFENTSFRKGLKAEYMGKEYFVFGVDFDDNLMMIGENYNEFELFWTRCENCKLIINNTI